MQTQPRSDQLEPVIELTPEVVQHVSGGLRPIELGGALAAFVLSHMFLR